MVILIYYLKIQRNNFGGDLFIHYFYIISNVCILKEKHWKMYANFINNQATIFLICYSNVLN